MSTYSNDFVFLLVQLLKVLKTEGLISGFVSSSLDRFRVLADSLIFRDKPWELDRNNSRPKQDILNYAVYNNGSAQARVFETTSISNESVFYFVNKVAPIPMREASIGSSNITFSRISLLHSMFHRAVCAI